MQKRDCYKTEVHHSITSKIFSAVRCLASREPDGPSRNRDEQGWNAYPLDFYFHLHCLWLCTSCPRCKRAATRVTCWTSAMSGVLGNSSPVFGRLWQPPVTQLDPRSGPRRTRGDQDLAEGEEIRPTSARPWSIHGLGRGIRKTTKMQCYSCNEKDLQENIQLVNCFNQGNWNWTKNSFFLTVFSTFGQIRFIRVGKLFFFVKCPHLSYTYPYTHIHTDKHTDTHTQTYTTIFSGKSSVLVPTGLKVDSNEDVQTIKLSMPK